MIALNAVGLPNNLYTQIGLMLLIALSAKNAILIVEVARERRNIDRVTIVEAAIEAARTRFRPILMTSIAFILGVVPLVTATGAGAAARVSLGLCVFSGMIASTCLAVLFVPSFLRAAAIRGMAAGAKEAGGAFRSRQRRAVGRCGVISATSATPRLALDVACARARNVRRRRRGSINSTDAEPPRRLVIHV